ncbi:MAG: hypothetical protein A2Y41_06970 [Spirochaetes bacterium GWB1_36_13]|nr:MAG: hypothetical protein A2Y41_06970 [Spirochaetes bacterium GWB1_36_13]
MKKIFMLSFLAFFLFSACSKEAVKPKYIGDGSDKATAPKGKVYDKILIKVNDKIVTQKDFELFKIFSKATLGNNPEALANFDELALKQMISMLVLEYFAEENKLEVGEKDITRKIFEITERMKLAGEEDFRRYISEQIKYDISLQDIRNFLKNQILLEKVQEFVVLYEKRSELVRPTEEQLKSAYEQNKKYFTAPGEVSLAHLVILVDSKAGLKETIGVEKKIESIREDLLKMKDIVQRTKAFYEAVEKEATKVNEAINFKKNKGELGSFDYQKLASLFPRYTSVYALNKGDISPMVVNEDARSIVMVTDKKGGETLSFEEAKPRIEQALLMKQGGEIFEKWINDYSKQFSIEINQ